MEKATLITAWAAVERQEYLRLETEEFFRTIEGVITIPLFMSDC